MWAILCGLIVSAAPALADGLSGTYVGKGGNGAFLVQIVETGDGHLTGRYEQVVLQPDGKLDDMNAAITGAADGKTVVVTIKPSEFLSSSLAASGTIEGRLLHLTGGGNGSNLTLNLLKSDEADFRAQVALLTDQGRQINEARARQEAAQRQAKAEADFLAGLQNLTQRMSAFTAKADVDLGKFAPLQQRYRRITARMRTALYRERSINGNWQAAVARSQIFVAINQTAIGANQINIEVQAAHQSLDFSSEGLLKDAVDASRGCASAHNDAANDPGPPGEAARNSACLRFFEAAKQFQKRVAALREAFARLNGVWTTERREQDAIVQASNAASR